MKKISIGLLSFLVLNLPLYATSGKDLNKIKEQLIEQSIKTYQGNCPCPYNLMRNGRICGRSSAYSRPRGKAPLCYVDDISDQEANKFIGKK